MSPAEQSDLEALRAAIQKEKINSYDLLKMLIETDDDGRKCAGYRSREALLGIIETTAKRIEKMTRNFERKYPGV